MAATGSDEVLECGEEALLRLELLDDRLDDELRRRQLLEPLGQCHAQTGFRGRGGGELALFHQSGDPRLDLAARLLERSAIRVVENHFEPGHQRRLRDARAHGARTHDAEGVERFGASLI